MHTHTFTSFSTDLLDCISLLILLGRVELGLEVGDLSFLRRGEILCVGLRGSTGGGVSTVPQI